MSLVLFSLWILHQVWWQSRLAWKPRARLNWPADISRYSDSKPEERQVFLKKKKQTQTLSNVGGGRLTSAPAPCRLMLSLEHGKQNLWVGTDGHWTKCVSSNRSWHSVHFSVAVLAAAAAAAAAADALVSGTCGNVGAEASMGVPGATPSGPPPLTGTDAFSALPAPVPFAAGPPTPLGPLTPGTPAPGALPPFASLDVTVVELTCRLPDDLRPLDEPPTKRDLLKKKKDDKSTKLST